MLIRPYVLASTLVEDFLKSKKILKRERNVFLITQDFLHESAKKWIRRSKTL